MEKSAPGDEEPLSTSVRSEVMANARVPFTQAVLPVIASAGMDYFGLGMLTPILPYRVQDMDADASFVGYITTAQYLGVLIGGIVLGRIADLYSRKIAIQIACGGDVIFFLLTGFCPTAELLLACRFFAGAFTPLVASISWVIDAGKGDVVYTTKLMSVWAFTMSSAFMAGSVVGGLLGAERWVIAHSLSSGLALFALICISMSTPPPRPNVGEKPSGVDRVVRAPEYIALLAMNVFIGLSFTGGIIASSYILAYQLGVTTLQISLFFVALALFHALFNFGLLPASTTYFGSPIAAMKFSSIVSTVAMVMLCFDWAYESGLTLCYVLLILASAIIPVFMTVANIYSGQYADRYSKNARSVVLGISRLAFNAGQVIGPLVATTCIQFGGGNYVFYSASSALFVLVFVAWLVQHERVLAVIKAEKEQQMASKTGKVEEGKEKDFLDEEKAALELAPLVQE